MLIFTCICRRFSDLSEIVALMTKCKQKFEKSEFFLSNSKFHEIELENEIKSMDSQVRFEFLYPILSSRFI